MRIFYGGRKVQAWEFMFQGLNTEKMEYRGNRGHKNGTREVDATPSGFLRITRDQIGRSSRNLVCVTFEQLYSFPGNFKPVTAMTFDLISKVMSSEICVTYRLNA